MSILDSTGDAATERAAMSERERPGVWLGDEDSDGRPLTQEQTDMLIRSELGFSVGIRDAVSAELRGILGDLYMITMTVASHSGPHARGRQVRASRQRGGIDSDPLVRLLAWRMWGRRDIDRLTPVAPDSRPGTGGRTRP